MSTKDKDQSIATKIDIPSPGQSDQKVGVGSKNQTLEREAKDIQTILIFGLAFVFLNTGEQVFNYAIKYFNRNKYPLPQTGIVACIETLKCSVFLGAVVCNKSFWMMRISLWYAIPSLVYTINNNIGYFALHYTTPPIWNVIIQLRIIFTALTYKFVFNRKITLVQWLALVLLMIAIVASNLSGSQLLEGQNNWSIAITLATVVSVTSVIGSFTMEYLFKNDSQSFSQMQLQVYGFGCVLSWLLFLVEVFRQSTPAILDIKSSVDAFIMWIMIAFAIIMSMMAGIVTAFIMKRLDNIVKLYTQALSNMLTSAACTLFFPDHFHLNAFFLGCLLLMCFAVYLYENKDLGLQQSWNYFKPNRIARMWLFVGVTVAVILINTFVWLFVNSQPLWGLSPKFSEKQKWILQAGPT